MGEKRPHEESLHEGQTHTFDTEKEDFYVFPGTVITDKIVSFVKERYSNDFELESSTNKKRKSSRINIENEMNDDDEDASTIEDFDSFLREYNVQIGSGIYKKNEKEVISSKAGKLTFCFDYTPKTSVNSNTSKISSVASSLSRLIPSTVPSYDQDENIKKGSNTNSSSGKYRRKLFCFIECLQKRYVPKEGDIVHGIIQSKGGDRNGEYYRVNIFGNGEAILPVLAFEGATKRSRPQLSSKSLVLCRVESLHNKELDVELSCIVSEQVMQSPLGKGMELNRKSWVSGEYILGELKDERLFANIHLHLARRLIQSLSAKFEGGGNTKEGENLATTPTFFDLLKKKDPAMKIYVGANGTVSIKASSKTLSISALNAILNYQYINDEEMESMIHQVFSYY